MESIAIQCKGIRKTYGTGENQVEALKPTDLIVKNGELTLLVGPSGSGKTTLISIIAMILKPDAGELIILDKNMSSMTENEKDRFRRENIGIVFQSFFLIPSLTLAENVALPLIVGGIDELKAIKQAKEILERVHLDHRANVSPSTLSKGQQQRVAIARAIINDAAIIICDEPTSSLDHVTGFEIMDYLHALAKKASKALLVVTHDPRIFSYADRVIPMSDGEITPAGNKDE